MLQLETFDLSYNRSIYKNITLAMFEENDNRKKFNGSFIPACDIDQGLLIVTFSGLLKNGRSFNAFNTTYDVCEFVEQQFGRGLTFSNLLLKDVRKALKNFPSKCPIKKVYMFLIML